MIYFRSISNCQPKLLHTAKKFLNGWVYKDFLKVAQTKATDDQHASKTEDP